MGYISVLSNSNSNVVLFFHTEIHNVICKSLALLDTALFEAARRLCSVRLVPVDVENCTL